ncbi:asparagine synthase (glutamine-hydrolyzing) [Pseudomonas sp. A-1]|uniref:asparagine synthase (glutamine-hydrolyzing) n=1 Tax=Pseudomonas sp. A-1 TaxID=1821274 RepID=UPI001455B804|nr:asparagine synthase (glutamine-hydrolyzing) [Pseudomonas sp. A-1]
MSSLQHRGPDGHGLEVVNCANRTVRLAHARLSILDLSPAGHQPMQSRDRRWWVTFNGEIYNHLELRKMLPGPFRGHSDTETLVELIAAHGVASALRRLNGMFAFAALDTLKGKLFLARDPFGIKPLYFVNTDEKLVFASEVRAVKSALQSAGLPAPGLDRSVLQQFLTLRYTPSPFTLWQGVERLAPGHLLSFDLNSGTSSQTCFVQATSERFTGTMEEAIETYQSKLSQAVERQLLSDVPVGILLSGGIDSALVAAMAKGAGILAPCFTVGFGGGHRECEIDDAAHTARVLGLPFNKVLITPEHLRSSLPSIVKSIEEPLGTTSVMPMWELVRRAREDVTVVLTGQGTDEPWGGYYRYQVELLRNIVGWPALWRAGGAMLSFWKRKPEALERGFRSLSAGESVSQIIEAACLFTAAERETLTGLTDDGGASEQLGHWLQWLAPAPCLSGAERMMRVDTRMNLADDLLLYADKISMAASLEARVPMLDTDLVQFVESLPIEYRLRWGKGKIVHKAMAERYLPADIVHRPKKGFQVPFGTWSRNEWRAWLEPLLLEGLDGLLRREGVERLWRQHLACKPDRSRQVFALMMLALWRQEHGF